MSTATPASTAVQSVRRFETAGGGRIFQLPVQMFPGLHGFAYLALVDGYRVLVDCGSGLGSSDHDLEAGLRAAAALAGERLDWDDLTHVLITHGHIDHFGGLTALRPRTAARIGVHELDLRNLTHYEERLAIVARRLRDYLVEAGVRAERRQGLLEMYQLTKSLYRSVKVDFTYEDAGMRLGPFEFLHVPGHCAGHVVIRLDDVLFSGDHVLARTSPHQSPERLTLSTGLGHYLKSLDELEAWAAGRPGGIRLVLGGHEDPITDLPARIQAIRQLHADRLQRVLELLETPRTVREVSQGLFGALHGYNILLGLEETGAHVEYLYQRGKLGIENLADLADAAGPAPIRYCRLD